MGCYGYGRNTSPNIDALAREGTRFTNYYCSDAPCLPSRAALLTGRFGIHTGAVGHGGTAGDMRLQGAARGFRDTHIQNGLWSLFRRAGMYTVSISSFPERHAAWWFGSHLNEQHNPTGKGGMESAEEVMPTVMNWLKSNKDRDDWALHVNLWDAHTPYRVPKEYGNPFENEPLPAWPDDGAIREHLNYCGPHGLRDMFMYSGGDDSPYPRYPGSVYDAKGVKTLIDGYDCGIRYMDDKIGEVTAFLKENGLYEDTCVIVTSDHGENIGELGIYGEHATADQATCRVPMIIKRKDFLKGQAVDDFHYNVDLCPTLAEMFGLPPYAKWDGISYLETLKSGRKSGHEYLVLSQCAHTLMRGVRFEKYLYSRVYHDGFHPFPAEMLFDLEKDPHERDNLAAGRPELCAKGAKLLLEWHTEQMLKSDSQVDPLLTVLAEGGPMHTRGCLEVFCKRLAETDRGDYAAALRNKHPNGI